MLHKTDQTREEEQKMNQGWGEKSPKHWKPRDKREEKGSDSCRKKSILSEEVKVT